MRKRRGGQKTQSEALENSLSDFCRESGSDNANSFNKLNLPNRFSEHLPSLLGAVFRSVSLRGAVSVVVMSGDPFFGVRKRPGGRKTQTEAQENSVSDFCRESGSDNANSLKKLNFANGFLEHLPSLLGAVCSSLAVRLPKVVERTEERPKSPKRAPRRAISASQTRPKGTHFRRRITTGNWPKGPPNSSLRKRVPRLQLTLVVWAGMAPRQAPLRAHGSLKSQQESIN